MYNAIYTCLQLTKDVLLYKMLLFIEKCYCMTICDVIITTCAKTVENACEKAIRKRIRTRITCRNRSTCSVNILKYSKILNTSLSVLNLNVGIHKVLVRIANREEAV